MGLGEQRLGVAVGKVEVAVVQVGEEREQLRLPVVVVFGAKFPTLIRLALLILTRRTDLT